MSGPFMHRLEQTLQRFGERLVTFRAAQAPGLLEIGLREAAPRAFEINAAGGLFDFLRSAQA